MSKQEDVDAGGLVKLDPASGKPQSEAPAPEGEQQKESNDAAPTA